MRHGSLFSGIGGFDLAAEWMGWENVFHCEWMPFPRQVLHYHFPNSISYEDITKTDFTIHRGTIDILTGGFPCQPYSSAGKRLGKEDERHLWPHMLRAIQEIEPAYVVGENVRGLTNWNGGVVFEEVCADLEACGYEVQPILLPACAVGAPHRRDRVWFVAYSNNSRNTTLSSRVDGNWQKKSIEWEQSFNEFSRQRIEGTTANTNCDGGQKFTRNLGCEISKEKGRRNKSTIGINNDGKKRTTTNTDSIRLQHSEKRRNLEQSQGKTRCEGSKFTKSVEANGSNGIVTNTNVSGLERWGNKKKRKHAINGNTWDIFPTQSPICGGDDGLPTELDGITFSKWRAESIKGYGNAIVPQVAYQIFKVIQHMEDVRTNQLTIFDAIQKEN